MTKEQAEIYAENQERLFAFMGLPYPYNRPESVWKANDKSKIVALSDPHIPYGNDTVLNHIEKHEKDAATIIVTGDLGDYYSKSRFRKARHQKFSDELREVFLALEWLSTNWQRVYVMIGNHDDRPEKHVKDLVAKDTDVLIMTEPNMLKVLAAFFDNVKIVGTQLDRCDINLTHIYQHGDIIFTHAEISRVQSTTILDRVEEWLKRWSHILQLKPFNIIAQSHNHRSLKEDGEPTRMLLPTSSNPYSIGMEYIFHSRMYGKPPAIGYSVFYQEKNITDTNRSNNIKFKVRNGKTESLS
jgi:UDP-2,3-diacylglucosamine pyrophosphatase LpxH